MHNILPLVAPSSLLSRVFGDCNEYIELSEER